MPISRFNKTDLLGGAIMDFLAKAGSGLSTGYGQAKDTEKFNDAFDTIQQRANPGVGPSLPPFSMPNMGPLAQLLQTQNGPGTIDLMKLLQPTQGQPEFESVAPGNTYGTVTNGKFDPQGMTPFKPESPEQPKTYEPSMLMKLQNELASMPPSDPRRPSWQTRIKREEEGAASFGFVQGPNGEYIPADRRHGQLGDGSGVYAPAPSEVRMTVSAFDDNLKSVAKIRKLSRSGSTGPVAGRAKKVGAMFFNDAEVQALISTVGQLRSIVYGLSGKAINESEKEWLETEILPRLEQPDENFETTLNVYEQWVKDRRESVQTQFPSIGGGSDTSDDDPLGLFK